MIVLKTSVLALHHVSLVLCIYIYIYIYTLYAASLDPCSTVLLPEHLLTTEMPVLELSGM